MKKKRSFTLASSMLLLASSLTGVGMARAGDFDLKSTVDDKGSDLGNFGRERLVFTSDVRFGYDDNTLSQPDHVTFGFIDAAGNKQRVTENVNTSGSSFVNFTLGAVYKAANPRATLTIGADVGVNYYFDRPGSRDYDINGGLTASFSYKATPRLLLEASSFNTYQSDPEFGSSNLSGFNGVGAVGSIPGSSSQQNGDFFYTTDHFAATYSITPRISSVTSYDLVAFAYANDPYSTVEDRTEHYLTQDIRYLLNPLLTLVGEYRFSYISYFNVDNDSFSNFALVGVDYSFNPRFRFSIRAGAEFREFLGNEIGGDEETSPYVETTLTYDLARTIHLGFTGRYGIEQGDLSASENTTRRAYRLGLTYDQAFTAKLSGYVGFYFSSSDYSAGPTINVITLEPVSGDFSEQTYDVATGLRYAFNRRIAAEVGYTHTTVSSDIQSREYDRNRFFGGVRFQF